jgi:hypothetical protein
MIFLFLSNIPYGWFNHHLWWKLDRPLQEDAGPEKSRGVRIMKVIRLRIEVAQLELSDLGREDHAKA